MYLKGLLEKHNCAKYVAMHLTKFLLLHSPQLFAHRDRIIQLLKWRLSRGEGGAENTTREEMGWECCTMRSGIMGKTDRNLPFWFQNSPPHRLLHRPTLSPIYILPFSWIRKSGSTSILFFRIILFSAFHFQQFYIRSVFFYPEQQCHIQSACHDFALNGPLSRSLSLSLC
jgi:hypothetical protein